MITEVIIIMAIKNNKQSLVAMIVGVVLAIIGLQASAASASDVTINPNDPNTTVLTLRDAAKVDISKIKVNADYVGEWVMVSKASVNHKRCVWTKNGQRWTNSASGVGFYPETTRAKICRSSQSSTGWVKVAGGRTGSPCYNPAIPPKKKQPKLKWKKVLDVKSLQNFKFIVNAQAFASIDLRATINCPSSSFVIGLRATAGSRAWGRYKVSIDSDVLLRSGGKVNGRVKTVIKHSLALDMAALAAAKASGQVTYKCAGGVTPPPQCPPGTIGMWPNCSPPPAEKPYCTPINTPAHVYVTRVYTVKIQCPRAVAVDAQKTLSGSILTFIERQGDTWSYRYQAGNSPGEETLKFTPFDGTNYGPTLQVQFPNEAADL